MGCCLTKKSGRRNKGLNETLLNEGKTDEEVYSPSSRGGYTPVTVPNNEMDKRYSRTISDGVAMNSQQRPLSVSSVTIDGLDNVQRTTMEKTRNVVGNSLLTPPPIKSLKRAAWLQKRGHMVRNWKKRFVVLYDGEILYYEKANKNETNGAGKPKGKIHLLGAICELKQNDSSKLPTIEIIGRQGEKDLLLEFPSLADAHSWFDTINWTIFRWNSNSLESGDGPEETHRWYHQQLQRFELDFVDLEKGYTFKKHGFDSITGDLQATNCILRGYREELCLKWSNIVEEDGKKKKSQPFIIYLNDIKDLIVGHYERDESEMRMMSIVSNTHTLDLEIIDQNATDVFTHSLSKCLLFMSVPVPPGMKGVQAGGDFDAATPSVHKANKKAAGAHKHGK